MERLSWIIQVSPTLSQRSLGKDGALMVSDTEKYDQEARVRRESLSFEGDSRVTDQRMWWPLEAGEDKSP